MCKIPQIQPVGQLSLSAHLVLICITLGPPPFGQAAINHCQDEAGRSHFQQFACPPGMARIEQKARNPLSVVGTAPLSDAEQQALVDLEQSLARERQARSRARARAARQRSARQAEASRACQEASRQLDQLAETRRRGYTASAEARLESEEARWRAARKASC